MLVGEAGGDFNYTPSMIYRPTGPNGHSDFVDGATLAFYDFYRDLDKILATLNLVCLGFPKFPDSPPSLMSRIRIVDRTSHIYQVGMSASKI